MYHLFRPADMNMDGMDKVKYYSSQIGCLLEGEMNSVVEKWNHPVCPAKACSGKRPKFLIREVKSVPKAGGLKTKGLEGDIGKSLLPTTCFLTVLFTSHIPYFIISTRCKVRVR